MYTSKTHFKRLNENASGQAEPTKTRRSLDKPFNFIEQCLFWREKCHSPDPKHPNRHEKVVVCHTTEREGLPTFKEIILHECKAHNDDLGEQVRFRVLQAVSDLHAADVHYHQRCRLSFRNIPLIDSSSKTFDEAFDHVISSLPGDRAKIWN